MLLRQIQKVHPILLAAIACGVTAFGVLLYRTQVQPEPSLAPSPGALQPSPIPTPIAPSPTAPAPATDPSPLATVAVPSGSPSPLPPKAPVALQQGRLRMSNQTDHPIRVALLSVAPPSTGVPEVPSSATSYREPVHWDFAPQEGSNKGLILSLPSGQQVQLQEGDVVVAFAQDGSQRYWGPFVVGKTASPAWNDETSEWLLTLQP